MVGGEAVALEQHVVVEQVVAKLDGTAQRVVHDRHAGLGHCHPHDAGSVGGGRDVDFLGRQAAAVAVVAGRELLLLLRLAHGVETIGRAEAAVGGARLEQAVGCSAIERQAFRLAIWRVRPADVGTLVPVEPEPAQRVEDLRFGAFDAA